MQAKQNLYRNVASAPARHLHIQDPVQAGHICDVWVTPQKLTWRRTAAGITMYLAIDLDLYQGVVAREDQTDNAYSLHLIGANRELNIEIGRFEQLDALAASWQDWGRFTRLPLLVETESGALRPLPARIRPDRRKGLASPLKYRRRRNAALRAKPDLTRAHISFKGAYEIICYE